MRSDFFSQINKNREQFYNEIRKTEYPDKETSLTDTNIKVNGIKLPGFQFRVPSFNINRSAAETAQKIFSNGLKYAGRLLKMIKKSVMYLFQCLGTRLRILEQLISSKGERLQESFYNTVIVLFDDEQGENIPEPVVKNGFASQVKAKRDLQTAETNSVMRFLKKIHGRLMISLELDESISDLQIIQKYHDDGSETAKPKRHVSFYAVFIQKMIINPTRFMYQKIEQLKLYPIVNRFI